MAALFGIDWDSVGALAGVAGVIVAIVGAIIAYITLRHGKGSAQADTAPQLATTESPKVTREPSGAHEVTFTARNDGKGTARVVSYAVRDALEAPKRHARCTVLDKPKDKRKVASVIAPDSYLEFNLTVSTAHAWFREIVDGRRNWAFEVVYTDMNAQQLTCTRFGVQPGTDGQRWMLTSPKHEPGE